MVDNELIFDKEITIFSDQNSFIFSRNVLDRQIYVSLSKDSSRSIKALPQYTPKIGSGVSVYSILGMISGKINNYILGVSKASFLGLLFSSRIFKIEEVIFISSLSNEGSNIIAEEDKSYLEMIRNFLKRNNLYYSDTLDLTLSMEKLFSDKGKSTNSFIFPRTVPHFCWNYRMTREIDSSDLVGFIHPVINGYIGLREISDYSQAFTYVLLARKDTRRSGMRFLVRGNDRNGFSANFAESEQILVQRLINEKDKLNVMSYLQIRGSIPLMWTQMPNLQLNPKIVPRSDFQENYSTFKKHMSEVVDNYGRTVLVNLIDMKGSQKDIGDYFQNLSKELKENKTNPIKEFDYVWFDFHQECKGMKYQNIDRLLKKSSVSNALRNNDFFHAIVTNVNGESNFNNVSRFPHVQILSSQKGVFRTNCVDCLDRTNVVQTVFSRHSLHKMLHKLDMSEEPSDEPFQEFNPVFESVYKCIWADHGDYLSLAYSGTKALKSDFVRTGKRTKKGAIVDGMHTCQRFYINNFCDGYNQDCHDYFLGNLSPKKEHFKEHSTTNVKLITPFALVTVFVIYYFLINLVMPDDYEENMRKRLLKLLILLGIFYLTFRTTFNSVKKTIIDYSTIDHF